MEVLILLVLILLLVIVLSNNSSQRGATRQLRNSLEDLTDELRALKKHISDAPPTIVVHRDESVTPPSIAPEPEVYIPPTPEPYITPIEPPAIYEAELAPEPEMFEEEELEMQPEPVTEIVEPQATPQAHYQPTESWSDSWLRKNPDLEKFIGENLINKIGIAILVLGIAFFVKYAIDKEWINEAGRVAIGFGCGAILVAVAHYLRRTYQSFSSVLAGGGIAVFYFTIAFAFHQYHLISQTLAFGLMAIITAFAVALSVAYRKQELAVIATIGGFITPFLVSTGEGNYIVLFVYLIILNIGLLALSYFKRWTLINIIALSFTVLIYGGWLTKSLNDSTPNFSHIYALLFGSAFYCLFLGMNMVNQIKNKQAFKAFDFSVLLFINAMYFAAGMCILHSYHDGDYQGFFTIVMGVINMSLAWFFYKRGGTERNLLFLLIGLTLTFLSLAIPVQLHGHTITLFWSAEFVLLYWLYRRSDIILFKYSSVLVAVLSFISLLMDWSIASQKGLQLSVIYTDITGFVTNLVSIAALVAYGKLLKRDDSNTIYLDVFSNKQAVVICYVAAGILAYITCVFGVNLLLAKTGSYAIPNVYHRLITYIFAIAALLALRKGETRTAAWLHVPVVAIAFFYCLVSYGYVSNLVNKTLEGSYSGIHLGVHYLDVLLTLFMFLLLIKNMQRHSALYGQNIKAVVWATCLSLLAFFSFEFLYLYIAAGYTPGNIPELRMQYGKAGLTLLWGISSFVMMVLGMKHKYKTLRIISLTVFTLTLLKLFTIDIRGISEAGKIIAFISLGVLLLVVSFMYQKLKKIIIDDKE